MQSTPSKKQATESNAILPPSACTPERRAGDTRGQMGSYTPEDLKAQLASRPRSVRSGICSLAKSTTVGGYNEPAINRRSTDNKAKPGNHSTSHRSEPSIMPGYSSYPESPVQPPSPSPSRPLMAMCDTLASSAHCFPSSSASFAYHHSTQSILARAEESYMLNWSPSSARSGASFASSGSRSITRKRGQTDEDDDNDDNGLPLARQGLVGAEAYDDSTMDEDGDETMMVEHELNQPLPLSHAFNVPSTRPSIPPLSFGGSGTTSSCASSSGSSSSDMFFAPSPSAAAAAAGTAPVMQGRQTKTLPRRSLAKTQSLPVEAFMSHVGTQSQVFMPDVFNATDGF